MDGLIIDLLSGGQSRRPLIGHGERSRDAALCWNYWDKIVQYWLQHASNTSLVRYANQFGIEPALTIPSADQSAQTGLIAREIY